MEPSCRSTVHRQEKNNDGKMLEWQRTAHGRPFDGAGPCSKPYLEMVRMETLYEEVKRSNPCQQADFKMTPPSPTVLTLP